MTDASRLAAPRPRIGREPRLARAARAAHPRPIADVCKDFGLTPPDWEPWGRDIAKVEFDVLPRLAQRQGNLVLVTAMTPTPTGEGKTITSIGLAQALRLLGVRAAVALRQPSVGPTFGIKGGATGGGRCQVSPSDRTNLHFTGDLHAVAAAQNLVAAFADAHLFHGNPPGIVPSTLCLPRCIDIDDRELRHVLLGARGLPHEWPHGGEFVITAASETMSILGLVEDTEDLRQRLGGVTIGFDRRDEPVAVDAIHATGAALALLRDAVRPNIVQTTEGVPAIIHGGAFGNVSTGHNTVLADRLGFMGADILVAEVGFGSDLGLEKFWSLVRPTSGITPRVAVVVATTRALRRQGGEPATDESRKAQIQRGLANLDAHLKILESVGVRAVVAINRFPDDTDAEVEEVITHCDARGVPAVAHTAFRDGGEGAIDLAAFVLDQMSRPRLHARNVYDAGDSFKEKVRKVATRVYGARDVHFASAVDEALSRWAPAHPERFGVCIAKTPLSLSDDPKAVGAPRDWTLNIEEIQVQTGARQVVALAHGVNLLPGLPRHPAGLTIDVRSDGTVVWGR